MNIAAMITMSTICEQDLYDMLWTAFQRMQGDHTDEDTDWYVALCNEAVERENAYLGELHAADVQPA